MPIVAMKVVRASAHPDPKVTRMRVYEFEDQDGIILQIVANLTNIYEVGDVAAIAKIGTVLVEDGKEMEIARASLRGADSYGMALGKVEEVVGTDLTAKYGAR